jgi:regulator of ribonuclease activity A
VVNGCVRDVSELAAQAIGVKALAICPRPSAKSGAGERNVPVSFAGVTFTPGHLLWGDADGIVVGGPELRDD